MACFASTSFENEQKGIKSVKEILKVVRKDRFAVGNGRVERSESAELVKRGKEIVDLLWVFVEVVEFSFAGTPDRVRERVRFAMVLVVDTESSISYMLLV